VVYFAILTFRGFEFKFSSIGLIFFILSGLFTSGIGRITFYNGIRRIGPSRASAIKNGAPLFTLLYAVAILGETFTFGAVWGIGLIIGGILIQGYMFFRQTPLNGNGGITLNRARGSG